MRNSPTAAGRILTLFSTVFLFALSFTVIFSDSQNPKHTPTTLFLYKRGHSSSAAVLASTSQSLSTPSPSQVSASISTSSQQNPSTTTPTPISTSTPNTSTHASSDVLSSTPTVAAETTTSSQVVSDSTTFTSSAIVPSSSTPNPDTSVTYVTSEAPTTIPKVTNQATVMATGTAAALPTNTISASAAPVVGASSSGFWANKGAVAGTFTIVTLIVIVLLFMGRSFIARRRRHARYRREDEEAYYEKSAQQQSGFGDSGLEETQASMTNVMTPASTDAYPDRQIHFGATASQGPQVNYAPQDYGIDYPPGANYHPAVAQAEYQHNANADNDTQGDRQRSAPSSSAHPNADLHNGNSAEHDPFYSTTAGGHAI